MSENIQSISQGTYTIGQTSATNFVAGPGIKIDEPSVGTVRIGNDETVLFENSAGVATGTLNEAAWNFNKIGIQITGSLNANQYFEEIPLSGKMLCFMSTIGADASYHFTPSKMYINNDDTFSFSSFDYYTTTAGNDNTLYKNGANHLKVVKVIGINRISGGNE